MLTYISLPPGESRCVAGEMPPIRAARINGIDGTNHGTGAVMLLVGSALKGGRVIADWPGLKEANLFENRDRKPTGRIEQSCSAKSSLRQATVDQSLPKSSFAIKLRTVFRSMRRENFL
jgi:uncharacterized protein (DUF1501 family)